jgi:hypothetical protein
VNSACPVRREGELTLSLPLSPRSTIENRSARKEGPRASD